MSELTQPAILVVEDQAAIRRQLKRALERHGFSVIEAGTAMQGLSLVQANHGSIDLAILDIVMPGMSGLDLAAELIREHPDIRILYTSGKVDSVAMEVIARSSPETVLPKPFTTVELIERVRYLLEKRTGTAPASVV